MEPVSPWLMTLMKPQWFVPLFVGFWLLASASFARLAGWRNLGSEFAAGAVPGGESFRFVSGSLGSVHWPVRYRNCLRLVLGDHGMYLAVMFPFSFQSPALMLPWDAVESLTESQLLATRNVNFRFRGHWPVVTLSGPIGQLAKAACERAQAASADPAA